MSNVDGRPRPSWRRFEDRVAGLYRLLGASVEQDVALGGNQIDILVTHRFAGGTVRRAVECKDYSRSVGIDVINSFAAIAHLLRQRGLVDKATIVAAKGFTPPARAAADAHGVDLLQDDDLEALARTEAPGSLIPPPPALDEHREKPDQESPRRVFVVMPFAEELEDVYVLGIREVAERLGVVVERADSIEHNAGILEVIQERLRNSDVVVAEATNPNLNVYYEIGFAHAAATPTILLSQVIDRVPFDLRGLNHIEYSSVVDLRPKLERRLGATLKPKRAP